MISGIHWESNNISLPYLLELVGQLQYVKTLSKFQIYFEENYILILKFYFYSDKGLQAFKTILKKFRTLTLKDTTKQQDIKHWHSFHLSVPIPSAPILSHLPTTIALPHS